MVSYSSHSQTPTNGPSGSIDPYVLFEALTGRKLERTSLPSRPAPEGYDDLSDIRACRPGKQDQRDEPEPDPQPKDVFVGCVNPFALAENMIGHKIDRQSITAIRIIQDTLQTDYEELFDMKHRSVLYAGLELNKDERMAEELDEEEIKILKEKDLVTPDLSRLDKLDDLENIGLKELGNIRIKRAGINNNKLHLVLHADSIARTVSNREVTQTINDFCLPFRRGDNKESFTPPNSSWRDARGVIMMRNNLRRDKISDYNTLLEYGRPHEFQVRREFQGHRKFDDPIQGATANSWFVAALFSVYWADPAIINRTSDMQMRMHDPNNDEDRQRFRVKFHDKGGRNNNKTDTVEVDYRVPVNNSSEDFVYCRSSDGTALWPSLYEKAFAKWVSGGNNDNDNANCRKVIGGSSGGSGEHVDITQLHHGDPVKAMAQINGREPQYYFTEKHDASDLVGLVRGCSVNHRTICPMVAWTYASDRGTYRGSNLVANHAYSVLGWSSVGQGDKQYIIVRNPWGTTEPHGLTSYPGILTHVEPEYWRPASLLDREGVMAVEVGAFQEYFACVGIAK
ncbi:hypothetical protein F4801DRAFT_464070 [Xylaria longipes]|nr:hypothetical protein F4801DRAFT_464070 [Xylaria longipes]RYC66132.1 hypothetical protein CHU98_g88 [Xylaria longipes]